eukprot:g7106.t1
MTLWFTNGWLRRGSKKRAQQPADKADGVDKEGADKPSYPTMKKAKKKEASPFEGVNPADTGSWLLLQDQEGRMYWWNDVTGQWTYQLYNSRGYPHLQQQLQHQHQHMMAPMQQVSYPQQHTAHLNHHPHYNPNGLHNTSPPLGPVSSPHSIWQQQQQWGLLSPSAHSAGGRGRAVPTAAAVGFGGLAWDPSFDDEDDEEEEEAGGTWEKFFDGRGLPVWIHSKTGSRTSVNPATA